MPTERHISSSPQPQPQPQSQSNSHTQPRVRQRSRRACEPCRKRKIKCDSTEPCNPCSGYGYDCFYRERQKRNASVSNTVVGSPSVVTPSSVRADVSMGNGQNNSNSNTNTNTNNDSSSSTINSLENFLASESIIPRGAHDRDLLHQSVKTRFTSSSSAISFPRILGTQLNLTDTPRLHSYAYNPGTRHERNNIPPTTICSMVSLEDAMRFSDVYFQLVHPVFGMMDKSLYTDHLLEFYRAQHQGTDFEAQVCYVVSLGSYFSKPLDKSPIEAEIVEQGRLCLELSTSFPPGHISVKHVAGFVLRALYLRSTTRPHLSWGASCTAVHLAEAIGLHRKICGDRMKRSLPHLITPLQQEFRYRTFWVTIAVNQFLAAEYGRTRVVLDMVDCHPVESSGGDLTSQTIALMQSVPGRNITGEVTEDPTIALPRTARYAANSPFLTLLRADVCFSIYRTICSRGLALSDEAAAALLEAIRAAMDGVKFLKSMQEPWWNTVWTPFHSICVLLSLRTSASLAMLPATLETLKDIVEHYDSHLAWEALRTATALIEGARAKMSSDLATLDRSLIAVTDLRQSTINAISPDFEWTFGDEFGFSDFLDFSGVMDKSLVP
ncbi:hypothetical protein BJ875DRAFT_378747 [Amylocarpus encephaloides]|uniref:Zn(2)-C6 fungal-type domain-containing protein n=1 Tax=Amylocarpus encephaloides TaxID=45428 RepID=A0A9P7YGL9_9HELO|nr:hypothetical protein BJ875DRAFT_378747 [Amylocarpus encephaloides]